METNTLFTKASCDWESELECEVWLVVDGLGDGLARRMAVRRFCARDFLSVDLLGLG
jgi:hypothetical protein